MNISVFYLKIFIFLVVKFSVYLNRHVFVMEIPALNAQIYRLVGVFVFCDFAWCRPTYLTIFISLTIDHDDLMMEHMLCTCNNPDCRHKIFVNKHNTCINSSCIGFHCTYSGCLYEAYREKTYKSTAT